MVVGERLCDRVAIVDHGRTIAEGTPRALIASLGAEHVLEFALTDGALLDAAALARALGGAVPARQDGAWRLQVSELHQAMPALLGELRRQDAQLSELRTRSATLEDVFVTRTGRQLRDD
jgi:ABC-2 type transport system ATP-binding protein